MRTAQPFSFHFLNKDDKMIYFDNSATTPIFPEVIEKMTEGMKIFGNPSSRHTLGLEASKELAHARESVARLMSADSGEIYFTSGGTESDNIAIFGGANIKKGRRVVTTAIEHPAVLRCFEELERRGFEAVYVKPQRDGSVRAEDILSCINKDTSLVSVMHVNNETGAVMPVESLGRAIKEIAPRALFHTDAVQSFGHIPFKPSWWGIDIASVSAHKLHGPKGTGALYVRKGVSLKTSIFGGGQEKGLRSGTENTVSVMGFGRACELIDCEIGMKKAVSIKEYLKKELLSTDGAVLNGGGENESPYILNISFGKIRSEIMLNALSNEKIYVSSGSACSSGSRKSHVLSEMGAYGDSAIRFSFSCQNTLREAEITAETIKRIEKELRR